METVHVELPDKGRIVVVLEQLRNQGLCKFVLIKDYERVAIVTPANEISVLAIFKEAAARSVSCPADLVVLTEILPVQLLYKWRYLFSFLLCGFHRALCLLLQSIYVIIPCAIKLLTASVRRVNPL